MPLPLELLPPLVLFAVVMSITPGPNNFMLMASGLNFGFRRTVPHMVGITIGIFTLLIGIGLGLGAALQALPVLHTALKWAAIGYLLWLAWRIASAPTGAPASAGPQSAVRPLSCWDAALFQWINPKAWTMALTAVTAYTVADRFLASLTAMAIVFVLVALPSVGVWTLFGVAIRKVLDDPVKRRIFNIAMAILLVASLQPMVADLLAR